MIFRSLLRPLAGLALLALAACGHSPASSGADGIASEPAKTQFVIGWSIYAGWMPWAYANEAGIVKKWADKYGITIKLVQVNDYVESVNQYTAGKLDGVVATSMDTLTIPAAGGKDTSVILLGDYSDGNDGVVLKNGRSLADIKGRAVNLVELSVSQYLLARGLEKAGMKFSDIRAVNTGDADIVAAFAAPQVTAVVTWNPQLSEVKRAPGATLVFDSHQIPNEILDCMVVSSATLKAKPALGKALAGIWYETLALMHKDDAAGKAARAAMARAGGATPESYDAQLQTTHLYYRASDAAALAKSPELMTVTDRVRQFAFANGLFGPGAASVDAIGIAFPGGKTLGDAAHVKLRFDARYMQLAADGKL